MCTSSSDLFRDLCKSVQVHDADSIDYLCAKCNLILSLKVSKTIRITIFNHVRAYLSLYTPAECIELANNADDVCCCLCFVLC